MDIRGLYFALSLTAFAGLLVSLANLRRSNLSSRYWLFATISLCLGTLLVAARGIIPDILSIQLANTLILLTTPLVQKSLMRMIGDTRSTPIMLTVTAIFIVVFDALAHSLNLKYRILIISAAFLVQYFMLSGAVFFLPRIWQTRAGKVLAGSFFALGVASGIRFAFALSLSVEQDLLALRGFTLYYLAFMNVFMVIILAGYTMVTNDLYVDELVRLKREADQASASKSQFLANMSHEIRTPLNAVVSMSDLLARETRESHLLEYARIIHSGAESLKSLLHDILDFSKIEAGQISIEAVSVDLRSLIEDVTGLVRDALVSKKLSLKISVESALPQFIKTDPMRFRQILLNLMANAVKFTQEGGVQIDVRRDDTGVMPLLSVSVSDTGIGIKKEVQAGLFKPFTQADQSVSRRFGGTGLGLAICKRLLEAMHGAISVESEPGRGSRFSFRIPLVIPDQKSEQIAQANQTAPKIALRRDAVVLVAEDNPVNQMVMSEMLARLGVKADFAAGGVEAIAMANRRYYDLIFMDVHMPDMDGYSATKTILQMAVAKPVSPAIVALTASSTQQDRDAARDAGMVDFISKPVTIDDIEHICRKWFAAKEGATV